MSFLPKVLTMSRIRTTDLPTKTQTVANTPTLLATIALAARSFDTPAYVKDALAREVRRQTQYEEEEPFIVCDLSHLSRRASEWTSLMPLVRPFYAVKCNPDVNVIRRLARLGTGFDCASPAEIDLVLEQGVASSSIIFAHPCKSNCAIRHARRRGVRMMTFDNEAELYKIKTHYPEAQLVLRMLADDETAICRLGSKYGASIQESRSLLAIARELQLNIIGVSFHVGSGAKDVKAVEYAIQNARSIWQIATDHSFDMRLLDIGGGFSQTTFSSMAPAINTFLERTFSEINCDVIAEPGRCFAEGAYTLACTVIAKRVVRNDVYQDMAIVPSAMLYLNDGTYGTFGNCIYEGAQYVPHVLRQGLRWWPEDGVADSRTTCDEVYTIWGPTCDSVDCINRGCQLSCSADVGDWLSFDNMGAYSTSCVTSFNGFSSTRRII